MIGHRGRAFASLIQEISQRLQPFFQTKGDILILTGSGTGGMEAAVVNTLSPGDKVLVVSIGEFGKRFAAMAQACGAHVARLDYEPGQAANPDDIRRALRDDPDTVAVLVTHNETSTGVTNPLREIAQATREFDKLLLVDGVSSVGSIPIEADAWGLDVVVTGSQKGWMVPPGLTFLSVSERAWQAQQRARMPRFYWDLAKHRDSLAKGQTPWTPALPILFGLEVALERMASEGLKAIFARHARLGQMVRDGIKALGLELLADERFASDTVTAVKVPPDIEAKALTRLLEDEFEVVLAGGQGDLAGKIFRIGHLGLVTDEDIRQTLTALEGALQRLGYALPAYRQAS
jgi:aspartate aminotransferase-like enzyme